MLNESGDDGCGCSDTNSYHQQQRQLPLKPNGPKVLGQITHTHTYNHASCAARIAALISVDLRAHKKKEGELLLQKKIKNFKLSAYLSFRCCAQFSFVFAINKVSICLVQSFGLRISMEGRGRVRKYSVNSINAKDRQSVCAFRAVIRFAEGHEMQPFIYLGQISDTKKNEAWYEWNLLKTSFSEGWLQEERLAEQRELLV